MTSPSKVCPFCGGVAGSGQHVFKDEFRKHFPRDGKTADHWLSRGILISGEEVMSTPIVRKHGQPPGTITVPVCSDCNSGWMDEVERKAFNLVVTMGRGEDVVVDRFARWHLAAWAALVTMTIELRTKMLDCEMVAIPAEDREELRKNGRAPPVHDRWFVGLGRYAGPRRCYRFRHTPIGTQADGLKFDLQATTFYLGALIVHVRSRQWRSLPPMTTRWTETLKRIWTGPSDDFRFRDLPEIDEAGADALETDLRDSMRATTT